MKKGKFISGMVILIGGMLATGCQSDVTDTESNLMNENRAIEMQQEENQIEDIKEDVMPMKELGTSWKDYNLQIDEQLYHFPMKVTELEDMGWSLHTDYEDPETTIDSACDQLMWFTNGKYKLDFTVYNPDLSRNVYKNCAIAGVEIDYVEIPLEDSQVFLPGGIVYGQSTVDDVLTVYEDPKYNNKLESGTIALSYQDEDIYSGFELIFDQDTGILNNISMRSYGAPADYEMKEVGENEETVTDYEYVAPTELGNDIKNATVLFDGDLYTLPAPVSVFLDNGWEIENATEIVGGSRRIGWQNMKRNGESFQFFAVNNSVDAAPITDCYIEELNSSKSKRKNMMIAGGIKPGIMEEELVVALNQIDAEYHVEDSNGNKYYQIILAEPDYENYCTICVSDGIVTYITVKKALGG